MNLACEIVSGAPGLPLVDAADAATGVVTKSEFARLRGCSPAYVSKLIRTQRLASPALRPDGKIDLALAASMLGGAAPQMQAVPRAPADAAWVIVTRNGTLSVPRAPTGAAPDAATSASASGGADTDYADARARRETANARLAELTLAETERRLIDRDAAERDYEDRARRFRDRILAVPAEVAADCVGLDDARVIEARMEAGIETALLDLAKEVAADAV